MCLLLEPLSFCLWQLSGTHSPKASFLARFRTYRTVALSAPALHDARAHLAGHLSVRTVQYHLALRLECPNIAPSTHHARHADAKRADIITIACEVEPTQSQSARPSLGGWRMARRMGQIRASGVVRTGQVRPANRNRHHPHHHHHLLLPPADAQPQITAPPRRTAVPDANRAHRAVGAAGARRLLACRSCPGVGCAKGCMRLSQRLWLADASRRAESVYRERVTKVCRALTYVGRQGSDSSEYIFSCIYRIR